MPLKTIGKLGFGSTHAQCEILWSEGFWGHPAWCHQSAGMLWEACSQLGVCQHPSTASPRTRSLMSHSTWSSGVRPQVRNVLQGFGEPRFSMPLLRRYGSGEGPARRTSSDGDTVDKSRSHSLWAFSLGLCKRQETSLWARPEWPVMFFQQSCGRIFWINETWLWIMRRQMMVCRTRTEREQQQGYKHRDPSSPHDTRAKFLC